MNIKGQSFLKLLDFTPEQIAEFLALAAELKAKKKAGISHRLCEGKQAALIFEKTSTRTRCSFEVAAHDLGMTVTYLDPSGSQIGKKESIADTARVLGRMYDGIEYRGYGQQIVEELATQPALALTSGTVYPLLSRLRKAGLVDTAWQESPVGPPRKYYTLTADGTVALAEMTGAWRSVVTAVDATIAASHPKGTAS